MHLQSFHPPQRACVLFFDGCLFLASSRISLFNVGASVGSVMVVVLLSGLTCMDVTGMS